MIRGEFLGLAGGLAVAAGQRCEQQLQIRVRERCRAGVIGIENTLGQELFLLLQSEYPVFDCACRNQFKDENCLVLANSVGAVSRLSFGRGIPPGIIVNYRVRRRKI